MSFIAETGSNHLVMMDGAPEGGGRNLAPRPMEMVLGNGRLHGLRRGRNPEKSGQDVTACEVRLTAERASTDPKVFTKIHMHWTVRGRGLKRNIVERVRLTHEKYCSATAMLQKTAEVTRDFEVIEA